MWSQSRQGLMCLVKRQFAIQAKSYNDDGGNRVGNVQAAQLSNESGIVGCHGIKSTALIKTQRRVFALGRANVRLNHSDMSVHNVLLDAHGIRQVRGLIHRFTPDKWRDGDMPCLAHMFLQSGLGQFDQAIRIHNDFHVF